MQPPSQVDFPAAPVLKTPVLRATPGWGFNLRVGVGGLAHKRRLVVPLDGSILFSSFPLPSCLSLPLNQPLETNTPRGLQVPT